MSKKFTLQTFKASVLFGILIMLVSCGTPMEPFKIRIEVLGLPEGAKADITATGPNSFSEQITETKVFSNLAKGEYKLTARDVIVGDKIYFVYIVYSDTFDKSEREFSPGRDLQTIQVKYELEAQLNLTVRGLPTGVSADITVKGVNVIGKSEIVEQKVTGSSVLNDLRPGIYEISIAEVSSTYTYTPRATGASGQLLAGAEVNLVVDYMTELSPLADMNGGNAVAIDENTMLLSSLTEFDNDGDGDPDGFCHDVYYFTLGGCTGSVSVLEFTSGQWNRVKTLMSGDTRPDMFGYAVAISGDIIAVGAPDARYDSLEEGAVYIFQRDYGGGNNWGLVTKLQMPNKTPGAGFNHKFGRSLALYGDTLVVGDPLRTHDANGDGKLNCDVQGSGEGEECRAGIAHIFQRNRGGSNNWGLVKQVIPSDIDTAGDDRGLFGYSVSIHNDIIVVGAPGKFSGAGAAYVFRRDQGGSDNWGEIKRLLGNGTTYAKYPQLGLSVATNGETVAVGVPGESGDANGDGNIDCELTKDKTSGTGSECFNGSVHIFQRDQGGSNTWGETGVVSSNWLSYDLFSASENMQFGYSVALSQNALAVGARNDSNDFDNFTMIGSVHLYELTGTSWEFSEGFIPREGASEDYFGSSVALDNNRVFITSPGYDSNEGAFYIFE